MKRNVIEEAEFEHEYRNYLKTCAGALEKIVGSELSVEGSLALAHVVYEHRIELRSGLTINPEVDPDRELSKAGAAAIGGALAKADKKSDEWRVAYTEVNVGAAKFVGIYHALLGKITSHESVALVA